MHPIPLSQIIPNPWQTRHGDPDPAYIKELALDIAAHGLLQIPVGRLIAPDKTPRPVYDIEQKLATGCAVELVFGHNRLAAYRWLQDVGPISDIPGDWSAMPVELRELTNEQMADFAWSENERRRDVDPVSRALAIQKRIDDFGWTHEQAAERLGISRPAVSNLLRLLKLPNELQTHLASGQISPRQAEALLGLYGLPDELRQKGESQWNYEIKPSRILEAAIAGESSENTRQRVAKLAERYTEKLNHAPWLLSRVFEDHPDWHAPTCADCDARLESNNWKYCTLPDCFRARRTAFAQDYLRRAGAASSIPALEGDKDIWRTTSLSGEQAGKLLAARCENLRLIYDGHSNGSYPHPEGFPEARVICQKQSQYCTCLKGLEQMQKNQERQPAAEGPDSPPTPGPTAERLEQAARAAREKQQENRKQVLDLARQAANLFLDALNRDEPGAWRVLAGEFLGHSKQDELKDLGSTEIRTRIADKLAQEHSYDYTGESKPDYALDTLNEWLGNAGLPALRWNGPDPAEIIFRRLERIEGWIERIGKYSPSEALQGNIDNLQHLKMEIQNMDGDPRKDDLTTRISADILKIIAIREEKQKERESEAS